MLTAPNDVVDASLHVRLNLRPDSVFSIHGQLASVGWSPSAAALTDGGRGNMARYPSLDVNSVSLPCVQSSLNDAARTYTESGITTILQKYKTIGLGDDGDDIHTETQ